MEYLTRIAPAPSPIDPSPTDPSASDPKASDPSATGMARVISEMETALVELEEMGDPRRYFHATYLRTTRAIAASLNSGLFYDPAWVERWDVAFAELYLRALRQDRSGEKAPLPWAVAFGATRAQPELAPLRHVLLGVNAHINYDLPLALLAVIRDEEFADPVMRQLRCRDHAVIDRVLADRVRDEDRELLRQTGRRALGDRVLAPLDRIATHRFLREAREKVWANAVLLSDARRCGGADLDRRASQLARLAAAKVGELTSPGQVLLRLAVSGFGVLLGPAGEDATQAKTRRPVAFRSFDPVRVGHLERDIWVAYYRREWATLLWASVNLVHAGFKLSWPATLRGAWFVLRANQLWAPVRANDPDGARRQMRLFYELVSAANGERLDAVEAARLEVDWWRAHREMQRGTRPEDHEHGAGEHGAQELVDALSALYAFVYSIDARAARPAAMERAEAMALSDTWVDLGCDRDSPLVIEEGNALVRSYAHLLAAVHR